MRERGDQTTQKSAVCKTTERGDKEEELTKFLWAKAPLIRWRHLTLVRTKTMNETKALIELLGLYPFTTNNCLNVLSECVSQY